MGRVGHIFVFYLFANKIKGDLFVDGGAEDGDPNQRSYVTKGDVLKLFNRKSLDGKIINPKNNIPGAHTSPFCRVPFERGNDDQFITPKTGIEANTAVGAGRHDLHARLFSFFDEDSVGVEFL